MLTMRPVVCKLFCFAESLLYQFRQTLQSLFCVFAGRPDFQLGSPGRSQHHHTHNTFGIHLAVALDEPDIAGEARSESHQFGRFSADLHVRSLVVDRNRRQRLDWYGNVL